MYDGEGAVEGEGVSAVAAPAIPVRRGSLSLAICDTELARISHRLGELNDEGREMLMLDADRWLDIRLELMESHARIDRSLG